MNRDSVAAGDDFDSHEVHWSFPSGSTVTDLMIGLTGGFLPSMGMWIVRQSVDGRSLGESVGIIHYGSSGERLDLPLISMIMFERTSLASLVMKSRLNEFGIHCRYHSRSHLQLATVEQMRTTSGYTGGRPGPVAGDQE